MSKKNKKKNKGKKVSWWKNVEKKFGGAAFSVTKPTEGKDSNTLSIALFKQSSLDKIAEICLPEAGGSEFQVHYRGVQFIITKEGLDNRIAFTIPTVFFNFPQTVTSASVDYNLDEVVDLSNQVAPISVKMAEQIAEKFPLEYFQSRGFNIEARELEMGSMHRHPGNFGFSSTDLDNQVQRPGVIFRNRNTMNTSAGEKIQVDSVMYIPDKQVQLVTTETRTVKVKPTEDETGIEGVYQETPTMSFIIEDIIYHEDFEIFFEEENSRPSKEITFKIDKKWFEKDYPKIEELLRNFLENLDYDPILIIDPKFIKNRMGFYGRKNYYSHSYGFGKGNTTDKTSVDGFDDFYDYPDVYGWGGEITTHSSTGVAPERHTTEEKRELTRPRWRKSQTIALLQRRGVNLSEYPEIDGSATDKDIIGIVKALKNKGYPDLQIKKFFTDTGYNAHEAMDIYYTWLSFELEETAKSGTENCENSNIGEILKQCMNEDEIFEAIEILKNSNFEDNDIREFLSESGFSSDILDKYYQKNKKP